MRDRFQIAGIILQRLGLHLRFEIVRQPSPHFILDNQTRLTVGDAEETMQHLFVGDGIAMARQRRGMGAAGN